MGGLLAFLDDIALLARTTAASADDIAAAAARASSKAAGVVIDDTAVTPQYVRGIDPKRELPIIRRIAVGSLRNKLLLILPIALLLSEFLPVLLTPILMLGGTYLCFEGAEKVWEKISGHGGHDKPVVDKGPEAEDAMVSAAIRTDLILSAEIMVISLNEVASESFLNRALILIVVALGITALVYGAVALLVKLDDVGLGLVQKPGQGAQRIGKLLVHGMPKVLAAIGIIGTAAMLWVGGHIILIGMDELGFHAPYAFVHRLEEGVHGVAGIGGILAWLVNTFFSLLLGAVWGAIIVLIVHLLPIGDVQHEIGHDDGERARGAASSGSTAAGGS